MNNNWKQSLITMLDSEYINWQKNRKEELEQGLCDTCPTNPYCSGVQNKDDFLLLQIKMRLLPPEMVIFLEDKTRSSIPPEMMFLAELSLMSRLPPEKEEVRSEGESLH